ncbi:MAG: hypothetical protein ACYDH9_04235 [Limisphaerales bacterium]
MKTANRFSLNGNGERTRKFKIIVCLVLVLSGGLLGCSTAPSEGTGTTLFDYSIGDSSIPQGVVVQGLGKSFSVRTSADSWPTLIQKVKPRFAWNGCDMMWVGNDKRGQPQFILDEAYIYQPTNHPRQWVLLKDKHVPYEDLHQESPSFFYSCLNLRSVATLRDTVPHSDHGEDYASAIATNRKMGTVYEIGWQREMGVGTAHPEYGRRIYVLRDQKNQWHFLGEGPEEGQMRGGGTTVESRVVWDDSKTNDLPVQIQFHCIHYDADDGRDGTNHPPDVVTTNEYVLEGKFPAQFHERK